MRALGSFCRKKPTVFFKESRRRTFCAVGSLSISNRVQCFYNRNHFNRKRPSEQKLRRALFCFITACYAVASGVTISADVTQFSLSGVNKEYVTFSEPLSIVKVFLPGRIKPMTFVSRFFMSKLVILVTFAPISVKKPQFLIITIASSCHRPTIIPGYVSAPVVVRAVTVKQFSISNNEPLSHPE